jgi:hypothetical protein
MDLMQRGFRSPGSGFRNLLALIGGLLKKTYSGLKPRGSDFGLQRMCPFCGLITPRHKASCLECGHALEKVPVG